MVMFIAYGRAREIAGGPSTELDGQTVAEVIEAARRRFGGDLDGVLRMSRLWLNGRPVSPHDVTVRCAPTDELVILPPVAGG